MANGVAKGRLVRPEARIPQSMLSSKNRFSKRAVMLGREAVGHWNSRNARLLNTFGVRIGAIEELELRPKRREPGQLEFILSERASLAAALPALAVALKGRGDLLDVVADQRKAKKKEFKENADRWASAAELEAFYSMVEENSKVAFLVRVGEGAGDAGRRKPGEGLNASLYPGQLIVNPRHIGKTVEELEAQGIKVYRIATDPIDGTGKTVMSDHSALTSLLVVDGEIKEVPDVYMEKLTVDEKAANTGLDTGEPLDKIVQGLSDSHRVTANEINGFLLNRDRHPIQELLDLGIGLVMDSDGDLLPGLAPGAQPGVYENGLPLHAMIGDTGGAAEYLIAAAANQWLGGASHGKFVSGKGMKAKGWEGRYDYTEEDVRVIEGAGFKLHKNYPISSLVDLSDGLAVFGGITSNHHFPYLKGVYLGSNFAQVDIIKVGASGRLTKRRFTFEFLSSLNRMAQLFSPVSESLMICDIKDIRSELRDILANPETAERLHREIGLSLYQVFEIRGDGKFVMNEKLMGQLGDARTKAIVENLEDLRPDWFA